ncbi:MAG TPA: ABC transporter ATP-binding protein [Candidatus Omnitrophica bacterium]|nr:MAG: ABC transporter ATP-binding protein [Omnitrophica WOR_2 bacterium GWA2_53_43]HBO96971.1 ABC transporter ATP-binding protein [Candidatus Omnitrophota bacterium]HCI44920.1 ABC transporter ATP-binding protein [Candidatus Omnitrophota bacterium]
MIEIAHLHKSFGNHVILNDLNLTIKEGETKVVIGRSGTGKSVLLKNIIGIMRPDSGSIKINGVEVTDLNEREYNKIRMQMGMVFQGGALFDSMNVAENVAFVLDEFMSVDKKTVRAKVERSLGMVGLSGIEGMMPSELSGGMRKRVSLARVLCMEPRIIFYDEPTTGVDPITSDVINNLIVDLRHKLKVTSIVVTHDMNSAYKVADNIVMLYHGQVVAEGTPKEIQGTKHPVVKQFINGEAKGPITENENLIFGYTD